MSRLSPINLPAVSNLEDLRRVLSRVLNKLVDQINNQIQTESLDANNNRIINVGAPALPTDAATKGYVDSKLPASK